MRLRQVRAVLAPPGLPAQSVLERRMSQEVMNTMGSRGWAGASPFGKVSYMKVMVRRYLRGEHVTLQRSRRDLKEVSP